MKRSFRYATATAGEAKTVAFIDDDDKVTQFDIDGFRAALADPAVTGISRATAALVVHAWDKSAEAERMRISPTLQTMEPPKMDLARLLNPVWGWFDSTGAWHHNPALKMSREEQLADKRRARPHAC